MRDVINPDGKIGKANKINREYYQIGRIMSDPFDRKSKGRKGDILTHFADIDESVKFTKRKYREIQNQKMANSRNRKWDKLKRNKIKKGVMKH